MDHSNVEVSAIEQTLAEVTEAQIRELNELQLVLVGGGYGDTII